MIKIIVLLVAGIWSIQIFGQGILQVSNGAVIRSGNSASIVLQDMSLVNNGILSHGTGDGAIKFTGNTGVVLSGSGTTILDHLLLSKGAGSVLLLQKDIAIVTELNFDGGVLNLGANIIDLGNSGVLSGESESSRAYTAGIGYLQATNSLNAPSAVNLGNFGAIISSASNLGNTVIRRGHAFQTNVNGNTGSLQRYYDIAPTNNTNINATLRFHYFDAELNGFDEFMLALFRSTDNITWANNGADASSTSANYVEKTAINAFSRWTLSSSAFILPVSFLLFNASCGGDHISLTWKTALELNTKNFSVEYSPDGRSWQPVASISSLRTSSNGNIYNFVHKSPTSFNGSYRIVAYDLNNRKTVSSVIKSSCEKIEDFKVWPNPVNNMATVSITSFKSAPVKLALYDEKGSLLQIQQTKLMAGSNQLQVNMSHLSQGTYSLYVSWGTTSKIIKLNKL